MSVTKVKARVIVRVDFPKSGEVIMLTTLVELLSYMTHLFPSGILLRIIRALGSCTCRISELKVTHDDFTVN